MGTNAYDIWDFVKSVGEKTCIIDHHSVTYARARCAVVCFDSAELFIAAVGTMPVLRNANLCWSCLISAKCAKCEKLGYMSLGCVVSEKFFSGNLLHRAFLDTDKSRLTAIYAKHLALVAHPAMIACGSSALLLSGQNVLVDNGSSSEMKLSLLVAMEINNRFAALERSLTNLTEQVGKLARKLDALRLMVPQPSPGWANVVMSEGLDVSISDGTVTEAVFFNLSLVSKLEDSMKCLIEIVLSLSAKVNILGVIATCNVRNMNNLAKQEDIIRWHKKINNLVFIITKTKLRSKVHPWIADKFNSIQVFTSGLNSGHLGTGVAVIMDVSLARHVCKVSEVPGWLLSIKLLFKDKLSVSILGLYAGVFSAVQFSQAGEVNSFIAKTVNESFFIVLGGDFNEDSSRKCASFRKCLDLGLANSLVGSPAVKIHTWANFRGVRKTIDYVLVSSNLVNAIVHCSVLDVGEHFETDHQAVFVFLGLGGLLDVQLNSFRKQANRDCWNFNFKNANNMKWKKFKDAITANATMFSDDFIASWHFSDLDAIWDIVCKTMVFLANKVFKKKWFKNYDGVFTKKSSKFYNSLDNSNISVVRSLFFSGSPVDTVWLALFKCIEESHIKSAINKKMESFELNKGHTIRSVLECPFCKVVLDYLVVDNELILEFGSVRSKVDEIIEEWTRKHRVVSNVPEVWYHQYQLLDYVFEETFFGVMQPIEFLELFGMVSDLPVGKAVGLSVVEDALEKNWKLWLVLQDMQKVYDSVGWEHLEKCLVITDFSLTDSYHVHDGLDQGEVFSPLLWCIFYDPLLCEVKHQKSVCGYRINSHFAGLFSFFAAEAFVDDTIWVGSSRAATQHILDVASEFFWINNISINNDKTVVIPINSRISNSSLFISGSPISIAKKGESHQYLGIFLSTDGLSKPSLAKAHLDICFFCNLVLKKAVSDKQFLYLVLAVLYPIVSYRTEFSFVPIGVCNNWNALIRKSLKLKSGLPLDFPIASLISFANSYRILGQLFSHRSYNLQVLCWHPIHLLSSPACVHVSVPNNFLSDMVCIFFGCNLSLGGSLASTFQFSDGVPMTAVLGELLFFKFLSSLQRYGIAFVDQLRDCHGNIFNWHTFKWWKKLDPRGLVPKWFGLSVAFLSGPSLSPLASIGVSPLDICGSSNFISVSDCLSQFGSGSLSVYTDGFLKNLGILDCQAGAAAFFENIDLGLGVSVCGLVSSTLEELQAIALALECIPTFRSVCLFSDSQAALDACKSELGLLCSDFCNWCWVKCQHIGNIIHGKNLKVSWHKMKGHFGILENDCANSFAENASLSNWFLPPCVSEHFLMTNGGMVSGNSRHFVRDIFCAVYHAHWEVGSGFGFLAGGLFSDVNWLRSFQMWHLDLHMATGFTNKCTADSHTYFMKTLHCQLPVAVRKRLYDRCYPSVLCLYCGKVEVSDHVFSCSVNSSAHCHILNSGMSSWKELSGFSFSSSCVLQLLLTCASDFSVFSFSEAVSVFHNPKVAGARVTDFAHSICLAFRNDIWLVHTKHCVFMEKYDLIFKDGSVYTSASSSVLVFSAGVVKLLGISETFGVCFGFRKLCSFFSGLNSSVFVVITA
ncbi:hypothetical protein G9A89_021806 [Geosiphon pyriformis]|nr:hypothetical protein G9A89_021806 [Geosiphon pyriformis]